MNLHGTPDVITNTYVELSHHEMSVNCETGCFDLLMAQASHRVLLST